MRRKTGLAIVGLGPAALPHAKSLIDLQDRVEVVHAVGRSAAKTQAFAAQFPFPVGADLDAVLADARVEAVLVLTPPSSHLDVASRCLAAGKHVLVEKPLELTSARAAALVAAADAARRTLAVVLQHRLRAGSVRLKQVLDAGELGAVQAASLTVPWWRPQAYYDVEGRGTMARDGGGVLLTQAIHSLDLFRALVGVSRVVAAQARTTALHRMETEDYVAALLETANGAPATLTATTAAYPGAAERIEIIAARGRAALVGGRLELNFLDGRSETLAAEGGTGGGANIMDFPHDAHRAVIEDFLESIATGRAPSASGHDALASQRLVDDILGAAGFSAPA